MRIQLAKILIFITSSTPINFYRLRYHYYDSAFSVSFKLLLLVYNYIFVSFLYEQISCKHWQVWCLLMVVHRCRWWRDAILQPTSHARVGDCGVLSKYGVLVKYGVYMAYWSGKLFILLLLPEKYFWGLQLTWFSFIVFIFYSMCIIVRTLIKILSAFGEHRKVRRLYGALGWVHNNNIVSKI